MAIEKIIAATDFSEASLEALETAFQLAQEGAATLYLVHVLDIPHLDDSLGAFNAVEEIRRGVARRLEFLIPENWQEPGTVETVVLEPSGSVAQTIARFAEERGADMIIVGTHGRSGLSRLLLGSTAESLLREAPCQVLVVKHKVPKQKSREVRSGITVGTRSRHK